MKQVGILFGGASSEYEVSLMSATSVLKNIDLQRFEVHKIGITKQGRQFYYTGDIARIEPDQWQEEDCIPCVISPDPAHHGVLLLDGSRRVIRLDAVFPVLHGKNGEDGTLQGLLTLANIPFVGCDTLSSATCMDKAVTHALLDAAGIETAKWCAAEVYEYQKDPDRFTEETIVRLGLPCFIKPANAGSSVGVSRADTAEEFKKGMELAFSHDKKAVIEEMIVGIELECAVLGNENPVASAVGEIVPCNTFYDYEAKYMDDGSATHIPARICAEALEQIRSVAAKAFRVMGCTGLSRVDFFLCDSGRVVLNEINTIPGFTKISMYPQLFIHEGISYQTLITALIDFALERVQG